MITMLYDFLSEKKLKYIFVLSCLLIFSLLVCNVSFADREIQELHNVFDKFLVGFEVNTFYRADSSPYYGARFGEKEDKNSAYGEIFSRLSLTAKKDLGWTNLEARVSPVFMFTAGQDVYGVYKDESDVDLDQGYLKFGHLFKKPIDVTVGMQDIQIEKQFIIGIGRTQDAALWLVLHQSWPFGVKVDCDFGKFKAAAFWARAENYLLQTFEGTDDVEATGVNLHFNFTKNFFVYSGFYAKLDDTKPGTTGYFGQSLPENDTRVWDIGFDFTLGGLHLEGEGAYQWGDVQLSPHADTLDRDAFGGYISGKYTFPVKFSPYIQVDYIYFRGDDDLNDDDVEEYDPMFWGFPGWNRWVIGELVGETQLPNTNKKDLVIEIGCSPVETMVLHGMYIKHWLDEEYFAPLISGLGSTPLSSDDWADEFDLYLDWQINDYLFVHVGGGYVSPNDAAEEVYGDDEDALFIQTWLRFAF